MPFVPVAALAALMLKLSSVVKQVTAQDWRAALTQVVVWVVGIVSVLVVAHSDFASAYQIGGLALAKLNGWSDVLVGMSVASTASVAYDFKAARDNTDSAAEPVLGGAPAGNPPPVA